jgi:hypothetical protein
MREKSIGKRTSEERSIEVFATRQTLHVNYSESKMVHFSLKTYVFQGPFQFSSLVKTPIGLQGPEILGPREVVIHRIDSTPFTIFVFVFLINLLDFSKTCLRMVILTFSVFLVRPLHMRADCDDSSRRVSGSKFDHLPISAKSMPKSTEFRYKELLSTTETQSPSHRGFNFIKIQNAELIGGRHHQLMKQ